jgi:uncharacterized membrane protein HdeD (DUF308 family)
MGVLKEMSLISRELSYSVAAGLFAKNWWVFLLRGLLAIFLGIMAFRRPVWTLGFLVLGFAVYATFEGVSALFAALRGWSYRRDRWLLLLEAVAGMGVGILALHSPGMTAYVLILFIAVWALATGTLRIIEAVNLDDVSGKGWLAAGGLAVGGIASIILTLVVLFRPVTGAVAMMTVLGIYALILGVTEIVLAFSLLGIRDLERSGAWRPAHPRAA